MYGRDLAILVTNPIIINKSFLALPNGHLREIIKAPSVKTGLPHCFYNYDSTSVVLL